MELNVLERITVLGILPAEGSFATLKIVRDLKGALSFSEDELKDLELKEITETGQITWKQEVDKPKEVEIGEKATDIIVEALEKLDKEKKLTEQYMTVYEKFVK